MVLRHRPERIGIELDAAGWVSIDTLLAQLAKHRHPLSREELEAIVNSDEKGRYAISSDGRRLRANQGHSVPVDLGLQPATPPDTLYHGTVERFLPAILEQGLLPMQRHHVHLSAELETAVRVGARRGTAIVVRVDAAAMRRDGHPFFVSENGVWLCEAVAPAYLSRCSASSG
jgi:putative RNA 2'-phosphotransferase